MDEERKLFEAWAADKGLSLYRYVGMGDVFSDERTKTAFASWQAALAARQPVGREPKPSCKNCGDSGYVDDGEIDCYPDGTPYMCGPVKCVRDCPTCATPPAPAVDLSKYRHALLRASGWARRSDVTSHAEDAGLLRELLALIAGCLVLAAAQYLLGA